MSSFCRIAAAALAIGVPLLPRALDYGGYLGVRYDRLDVWSDDLRLTNPRTELIGDLAARGFVYAPSALRWDGQLHYDRVRGAVGPTTDASDGLTYRLGVLAFNQRGSPIQATGSVYRSRTEFSYEAPAGSASTGVTTSNGYDASIALSGAGRPSLNVAASRIESVNSGLGRPPVETSADRLRISLREGTSTHSLSAVYAGTWNEGTLAPANFVMHNLDATAVANFRPRTSTSLRVRHLQRIPELVDPSNLTTEATSVDGLFDRFGTTGERTAGRYTYTHESGYAPGLPVRDLVRNELALSHERRLSQEWSGNVGASASLTSARAEGDEVASAGQTLSALARWTSSLGNVATMIEAGPRFGFLEHDGQTDFGRGAAGRARFSMQALASRYGLEYLFDYENNLSGRQGWFIRQTLDLTAEHITAGGVRLYGLLSANGQRFDVRPFGTNASRNLRAVGTIARGSYSGSIEGGLTDALQQSVADSIVGDGLFFPAAYNSNSKYASLTGTARLSRRLSTGLTLRYATQSGADVPSGTEKSAYGTLTYYLGQFALTLEDRYVIGGSNDQSSRTNTVLVTLSRSFRGRL